MDEAFPNSIQLVKNAVGIGSGPQKIHVTLRLVYVLQIGNLATISAYLIVSRERLGYSSQHLMPFKFQLQFLSLERGNPRDSQLLLR